MAKILIVEDEKAINQLMKQNLVLQGHQVMQAFDGRQALEILDSKADLDLVILDIMLPYMSGMELIKEMANETIQMVTSSVDAFVKKDVELAEKVIIQDNVVDDYFSKMKRGIISLITENSADGEFALDLLMISKYFERIGDHATNIAEWVIYSITGIHKEV